MQKPSPRELAKTIGRWIPALLLASMFIPQGLGKFSATSGWRRAFEHWGYPHWFLLAIGGLELLAGLLVLYRRTAPVGALLIITVMAGAMWTHVWIDHRPGDVFHEAVPMTLSLILLAIRRAELRDLTRRLERE
jgi:putative oxidoreductase